MNVLQEILSLALAAAPWLLLGLFVAGLVHAFMPRALLQRWAGGRGIGAITRAAVIGAPLPLCSCGAIPAALSMYRNGADRGPSVAFLIGTPGIGVDSVIITYALLGPFMMVARALGAVVTAIGTGLLVARTGSPSPIRSTASASACPSACCGSSESTAPAEPARTDNGPLRERMRKGIAYAFGDLLDDISLWLLIGLVLAGVLIAFVPAQALASYGSGLLPMLLMAVIGVPLYICATAATPVAAGMLVAGVSPGTVLVFLLAGPMTSMAMLGVLRREMGNAALGCYLFGIVVTTVAIGLLVDLLHTHSGISIVAQVTAIEGLLPQWLKAAALILLVLAAVRPLRRAAARLPILASHPIR